MAGQQYSSELEMANSASLSVYDGDSAYAPKIDPAKEAELYMVSTSNKSHDRREDNQLEYCTQAHALLSSYWSKKRTLLRRMLCQQSTSMPKL